MLAKLPPMLSVPLFYGFVTVAFLYRFLFGNIYGIFITTFIVYHYSKVFIGVTPLGLNDLIYWFSTQSESTKTAILASIITIIGFLIAYATATANWKAQLLANLKLQAAGEIEVFFAECAKLSNDCKIYASALIDAVDKIQKGCPPEEAVFLANYNRDQGQGFFQNRQRLASLGIEVHRLQGKYSTLLITAPGLKSGLDSATKALQKIVDKVWIYVPYHIQDDPDLVQSFINQVNISECMELKNSVEEHCGELSFSSGGVRGNLLSAVVGFNIWSLIYIYKERKGLKDAITERYNKLQNSKKVQ